MYHTVSVVVQSLVSLLHVSSPAHRLASAPFRSLICSVQAGTRTGWSLSWAAVVQWCSCICIACRQAPSTTSSLQHRQDQGRPATTDATRVVVAQAHRAHHRAYPLHPPGPGTMSPSPYVTARCRPLPQAANGVPDPTPLARSLSDVPLVTAVVPWCKVSVAWVGCRRLIACLSPIARLLLLYPPVRLALGGHKSLCFRRKHPLRPHRYCLGRRGL